MKSSPIMVFLLGCCLVLMMSVQGASAIQCYSCSGEDEGCQDEGFNKNGNIQKIDCLMGDDCMTWKVGAKVTVRDCGMSLFEEGCTEDNGLTLCSCRTDLCNGV